MTTEQLFLTPEQFAQHNQEQQSQWTLSYSQSFGNDTWKERGICASLLPEVKCPNGFSEFVPDERCNRCDQIITKPAYSDGYITQLIQQRSESATTYLYQEIVDKKMALGAIAWLSNPDFLIATKYPDLETETKNWLRNNLPQPFGCLEEYWSSGLRQNGNMVNFEGMITGLAGRLQTDVILYRSIVEQMKSKPQKVFGNNCQILAPQSDNRFIVQINLK